MTTSSSCSRILRCAAVLVTLSAGHALAAPTAKGRIVYGIGTTTPQQRSYDPAGAPEFAAQAATVTGATPTFVVDRAAPTRNEHVAGYVTTGGVLYVMRWNGTAWSNEWNVTVGGAGVNGRRFDIAYEATSGRAMVVYSNNTNSQLRYNIWNGTGWVYTTATAPTVTVTGLAAVPNWVKLASRRTAGSNEIAAAVADTAPTNPDLAGVIWNGSAWDAGTSLSTTLYQNAAAGDRDVFDLAYESQSGDLFVVYSEPTQQYHRTYSAGTWGAATSWATGRTPGAMFATANPDPASNEIVTGFTRDASANVYARIWDGATLGTSTAVGGNGQTSANNQRTITGGWVKSGATTAAVVMWGSTANNTVAYAYWIGGTWTTLQSWTIPGTSPVARAWMDVAMDPQSGGSDTLMHTFSDTGSDLWAKRLVFTAPSTFTWSNADGGAALTATLTNATTENFAFEYDRYVPPAVTVAIGEGTNPANGSITATQTAALDAFTLATNTSTATVTAVGVNLSNATALSSVSIQNTSACNMPTPLGTLASPVNGANTISLTTNISVTTTAGSYWICAVGGPVATGTAVTGTVDTVTAGGAPSTDADLSSATVTVQPVTITIGEGTNPANSSIFATQTSALDAFTLTTDASTATVTAVGITLTNAAALSSASIQNTSACNMPTPLGTLASPAEGANTVTLTTSIGVTATAGNYWICVVGGSVAANTSVTGNVTAVTAANSTSTDSDALSATVTVQPIAITIGEGTNPANSSIVSGQTAALDAFTLATNVSTATVTAVAITLTNGTALSGVSIQNTSACNMPTPLGTLASPVTGANTVNLGTSINVTTTPGNYWICVVGGGVAANTNVTGNVTSVTAANATSTDGDVNSATVTVQPITITIGEGTNPGNSSISAGQTVALDAFTLATSAGSTAVTAVGIALTNGTALASVSIQDTSACSMPTPLGTLASPVNGANTITLTTTINATTVTGSFWICVVGGTVAANTNVTGNVNSVTAGGAASTDADLNSATVTVRPPVNLTIGEGTNPANGSISSGQVTALDAFTLATASGTATVTAVTVNLTNGTALSNVSIQNTSACNQAPPHGTLTSPLTGSNTVTLTTSITATTVASSYWVCVTGGTVAANTNVTGTVNAVTAVGYASVDNDLASATVTVQPPVTPTLAVTAGTMPAAGNVTAGSSGNVVGRVVLTAGGGTVTLSSIAVSNTGAPAAVAVSDVSTLALYDDTSGAFVGQASWNATTSRYEFTGLGLDVTTTTPVTLRVVLGVNIGATAGRVFAMRVLVPGDVTVVAPSTVSNTVTISGNAFTIIAGGVAGSVSTSAPMVSIINPSSGAVVSPNNQYKVQIRIFNPAAQSGIAGITANSVQLSTDNGATWTLTGARNTRYDSGTPTVTGTVYEVLVTGQASGSYTLRARASNASVANVLSEPVQISVAAANKGDGNLLVRDNSAQLCTDCHALQTHSSESVGTKYGSWAVTCRDCHSPHGTRNIMLVRENITPPSVNGVQTAKNVGFVKTTGDSGAAGWDGAGGKPTAAGSFVNSDTSGPCQVCHTRTQSPGAVARWRNTGNADTHYAGAGTQACTNCHGHGQGFGGGESAGGAACSGCHTAIKTLMAGTDGAGTGSAASKHSLVGFTDSANDTAINWSTLTTLGDAAAAPANRSCVNMCHSDHPHDLTSPLLSTHDNNLYLDPSTQATRGNGSANRTSLFRTKTDFDPTGNAGMCTKCHSKPIAAGRATITDAAYGASAHDFTSTASPAYTWQYTLHDSGTTQRNCTKCHTSRTEGTTPSVNSTGVTAVHGTSDPSLLAGTKRPAGAGYVCYNCHGSTASPAAGAQGNRSNKDVESVIAKAAKHPVGSDTVHDTVTEASATYNDGKFSGANRHVNCQDCHDPHEAGATKHTQGTNAVAATSPLYGASGAGFTSPATNWAATTSANFTWKNGTTTSITAEYELCFKCHSSFAFGATPPANQTDVAQEFSTSNQSYHPLVGALPVADPGANGSNRLAANQLNNGWVPGQTMYCSDCHGNDAAAPAAQGPHGSAQAFILKGPNRYWPVNASAALYTLGNNPTNNSHLAGLFCTNCHPVQSTAGASFNNVHTEHAGPQLGNVECIRCHILVPHGGKISRLIGDRQTMPTRYAYQGLLTNMYLETFIKAATPTGYVKGNCAAPGTAACSTHAAITGENW